MIPGLFPTAAASRRARRHRVRAPLPHCRVVTLTLAVLLVTACGDGEKRTRFDLSGTVVDFETGNAVTDLTSVQTAGLSPVPLLTVDGSGFTIESIPGHSLFDIVVEKPPTYATTFNAGIEVLDDDVNGIQIQAVRQEYLDGLAQAFGAEPGGGILLVQTVTPEGQPVADIPLDAFETPIGATGPFAVDENLVADVVATATSASGYAILFNVTPGLVALQATTESNVPARMAEAPVTAGAVTIARVVIGGDDPTIELPENVSFARDVAPIFLRRGCDACHDGGGIGKDQAGLHLNGATEKMYRELAEELSPNYNVLRIDTAAPEQSLLLTMPSREDPPDRHPNITFTGTDDPDYLTILAWIREGALDN